jgi:predicted permease
MQMVGQAAVPLSLIALGMGLAEFGVRAEWRPSVAIALLKLVGQPIVVYALAVALALPAAETAAIVMLAALPVGANVYLMSRQFGVLGSAIASAIVLTTAIAAVTMPLALTLIAAGPAP